VLSSWLPASATVCAAFVAVLFAYRNNLQLHQAQERLNWINTQLRDLYGPMYSICEAGQVAWDQFRKEVQLDGGEPAIGDLTGVYRESFMSWMRNVFMPANRRLYELIVSRSHLLVGERMPDTYKQFCAHVAAYEVILYRWEQCDESMITASTPFPSGFREEIQAAFIRLKRQQQELLKSVEPRRPWHVRGPRLNRRDNNT
jgi:hypothetical protein